MRTCAWIAAGIVCALSTSALAQAPGVSGARASPGADLLEISATRPLSMQVPTSPFVRAPNYPNGFRVLFRITTTTDADAPIVVIGHGGLRSDYVYGWSAFSSTAATCELDREAVRGLSVYRGGSTGAEWSIRELAEESTSETVAGPTRPTVASVDFRCDGPIEAGDTVTVQIKLFVLNRYSWVPADFTFVDLPVVTH